MLTLAEDIENLAHDLVEAMDEKKARSTRSEKRKSSRTNFSTCHLPKPTTGLVDLADWVEMKALLEADGNASQEDLPARPARLFDGQRQPRALAGDVFKELLDRQDVCSASRKGP